MVPRPHRDLAVGLGEARRPEPHMAQALLGIRTWLLDTMALEGVRNTCHSPRPFQKSENVCTINRTSRTKSHHFRWFRLTVTPFCFLVDFCLLSLTFPELLDHLPMIHCRTNKGAQKAWHGLQHTAPLPLETSEHGCLTKLLGTWYSRIIII